MKMILRFYAAHGLRGFLLAARYLSGFLRAKSFASASACVTGKSGIEFGGPSDVFRRRGIFPVYPLLKQLDNCNFSSQTLWGDTIADGAFYVYDPTRRPGRQFIHEAANLRGVFPDCTYEVVLASHVLEHLANPLQAINEWFRLLTPSGLLVVIVPDKNKTFDHRRSITPFAHLQADLNSQQDESDMTHLDEIIAHHDISRDPGAIDTAQFIARAKRNVENRGLHHHVFDEALLRQVMCHGRFMVQSVEAVFPNHILVVARKSEAR